LKEERIMGRFEDEYSKECPYCEEQFMANRINQKFCSHRCKYTFNNRKRSAKDLQKAKHQKWLDQNHKVLSTIYNSTTYRNLTYSKQVLISKGFSFQYLTRVSKTNKGNDVVSIYNFFLLLESEGNYKIDKAA